MISSVGWKPYLVMEPAKRIGATRLILVHTIHEKTLACLGEIRAATSLEVDARAVPDNFNFGDWYRALDQAIADAKRWAGQGRVTINLTAGHAITIANLGILAERTATRCIMYDDDREELHPCLPRALTEFPHLSPLQLDIIQKLEVGELAVADIVRQTGAPQSTVSHTLGQLMALGLLDMRRDGRRRLYSAARGLISSR